MVREDPKLLSQLEKVTVLLFNAIQENRGDLVVMTVYRVTRFINQRVKTVLTSLSICLDLVADFEKGLFDPRLRVEPNSSKVRS